MDLQLILALNALTISAMAIAGTIVYRPPGNAGWLSSNGPWIAINALVLAVGGLTLWLAPDWTGWAVLGLFLPFVAAPVVFYNLSQRRAVMGRLKAAARYGTIAAILHPTAVNWMNAKLLGAVAKSTEADATPLRDLLASAPPPYRPIIEAQLALVRRDWNTVLALSAPSSPADAFMKPLEMRALGEIGETDAMVRCYFNALGTLHGGSLAMPQLFVLAFGGRPEATRQLLGQRFRAMPKDLQACWAAIADLNSPDRSDIGYQALARLARESTDDKARAAAKSRLEALARMDIGRHNASSTEAALDVIAAQVLEPKASGLAAGGMAPVTLALVALNVAMFVAEIYYGGSENEDALTLLGAMDPTLIIDGGQWWRLLSCMFLHFGFPHILSNMFVLLVLGRNLEPLVGSMRMLVIYMIGGVLSSASVLWLMWSGNTEATLLVGASGAIFALFGAEVMIVLKEWRQSRGTFDRRRLVMLGVILLIQATVDISVPSISFSAHASGFITGMVVMLLFPYPRFASVGRSAMRPVPLRQRDTSRGHDA